MLGNVWEWCADWYDEKYYASSPSVAVDPPGPSKASTRVTKASTRVIRGGCWFGDAWCCRPADRNWGMIPHYGLGFRVAAVQE